MISETTSRHGVRVSAQRASESASERATARTGNRFIRYWESGDVALRNELVLEHRWLAEYCARRFAHRGESGEDLVQVAQLALVKAVERFNPHDGSSFAGFAVPTILGEIKRHFRDATWPVRVPRRATDLLTRLAAATDVLSQRLGRGADGHGDGHAPPGDGP